MLGLCVSAAASDPDAPGDIQGMARNPTGAPVANATVTIHSVSEQPVVHLKPVISGNDTRDKTKAFRELFWG